MHIEIGIISPEKLAYAGVAATALLGAHTMGLLKSPTAWLRTALAAFFFSLLMQGDSCNGELNERLGLPPNLLSHHLRVLREVGLVRSRHDAVDARWIYYTVEREAAQRWQMWFSHLLNPTRIEARQCLCGPEGQQRESLPLRIEVQL